MLSRGEFVKVGVQKPYVLWTGEGVPFETEEYRYRLERR